MTKAILAFVIHPDTPEFVGELYLNLINALEEDGETEACRIADVAGSSKTGGSRSMPGRSAEREKGIGSPFDSFQSMFSLRQLQSTQSVSFVRSNYNIPGHQPLCVLIEFSNKKIMRVPAQNSAGISIASITSEIRP